MTKTINLIIQSKGGAGKSMLTYLLALKHEQNDQTLFIDLDNSTMTSKSQLQFLDKKGRFSVINITNAEQKIDREKLFEVIEEIASSPFQDNYIDFGAPESEQLPNLLKLDFSSEDFKAFETEIEAKIKFLVVVAGGTAYVPCMRYLELLANCLNNLFEIEVYANEFTFMNTPELLEETEQISNSIGARFVKFGKIYTDRKSGQDILHNAKEGKGMKEFTGFATKTTLKVELEKI